MNFISNILYWISTGLLVPVVVLLIFFFIRAIIMIGNFFGQYMSMKKVDAAIVDKIKKLDGGTPADIEKLLPEQSDAAVVCYIKKILSHKGDDAKIDLMVSEYELLADKNLALSKTLTKMGPILGLMGTLIPMGPALVGLATGDIASMAYNMQVAFATTVVGLVISAIGFLTQQVKERWYVGNLTVIEYVAQLVKEDKR